nr:MAG TPA: protein of unknown function DUF5047 [Bacteriophage sp.]
MALNITQQDYRIIKQPNIQKYVKINLLDFEYNVVDEISGRCIDFTYNEDANADLRRSCSVSLVVADSSFDIKSGGKIWLDKYIQPYVGYQDNRTGEIAWYNKGIFLINSPSWNYNGYTNTLSFSALDLMSKLTGLRNGNLEGIPTRISQGENVRGAIIAALELGGFKKYVVSECTGINDDGEEYTQEIPYDIEIDQGGTVYDILTQLRDILPKYEMFFDEDGVFHYQQIPTGANEPVSVDDDLLKDVLLDETINTDFESVKNYIEVYGHTWDIEYYSDSSTTEVNGSVIKPTFANLTNLGGGSLNPLPEGYTTLKWIELTGTQWINTGVKPNQNTDVIIKAESAVTGMFIGASENTVQNFDYVNKFRISTNSFGIGNQNSSTMENMSDYPITLELNSTGGYKNGTQTWALSSLASFSCSNNLGIGAWNRGTVVDTYLTGKIYSCQIYDGSTLSRYFIPCKNADGVVGMYDIAGQQFYENAGSGNIIAGDEIEPTKFSGVVVGITLPEDVSIGNGANVSDETLSLYGGASVANEKMTVSYGSVSGETLTFAQSEMGNITINFLGIHNVVNPDGSAVTYLEKDKLWVFAYTADGTWEFMGGEQAQAIVCDDNPDSPFYVGDPVGSSSVGRIRIVLAGGEYDNIYSDYLAKQRAEFELYQRCRLQDSIQLTTVPIPWVTSHLLISHAIKGGEIIERYLVESINVDYGSSTGTMTINAIKYYPYYPDND